MLIFKYRGTLLPEQMDRLAEGFNALRGECGPVLVLDADCQLFQHVDGRWVELGQPVEDLDHFPTTQGGDLDR